MALLDCVGILILGLLLFVFMKIELNGEFYRMISFISLISYSLYIYHFPILHHVVNYNLAWYLTFPLFFAVSVSVAAISYYIIEAPFLKYSAMLGRESRQPAMSA
jgi:peptidoglycan/LPS O-acetylase OafA/YrhL